MAQDTLPGAGQQFHRRCPDSRSLHRSCSSRGARRTCQRVLAVASPQGRTRSLPKDQDSSPASTSLPGRSLSPVRPITSDSRKVATSATSSAQAQVTGRIASIWGAYTRRLEADPVRTKALTSFMGFMIGDFLAQRIGGEPFDPLRCLRLGAYGLFLDGPIGHWWYKLLDRFVMPDNSRSNAAVLIKTAADQVIWAPFMTVVFFAVLKSLEGHPELIMSTVQDKLVKTVVANYILWPGAHFINFKFVPTEHRILYNNCVSVVWNAFLSTLSHTPEIDTDQVMSAVTDTQRYVLDAVPPALRQQLAPLELAPIERLWPEGVAFPQLPSNLLLPPFERLLPEGTTLPDLQLRWELPKKIMLAPTHAIHPMWLQWLPWMK